MAAIQLFDKSDPTAARIFLEQAIRLNPDSEDAISEALIVYQELNDLKVAWHLSHAIGSVLRWH